MVRRRVDLCAVQEVRYKGQSARFIGGEQRYKLWWSGGRDGRYGVGLMLREELVDRVIEVVRISDRLMKIKMVLGRQVAHIFSVYAPQQGRPEEEKTQFKELMSDQIEEVPARDVLIIAGDLNAHVGQDRNGFEEEMGRFGFGERNREGEELLRLCQENNLKIVNTWYKKRRDHQITYRSGDVSSQIDYMLMRRQEWQMVKDCKVIPGEECLAQHRLLCVDLHVADPKRRRPQVGRKRLKIWKLKEEETRRVFEERLEGKLEDHSGDWNTFKCTILETAREICGESSGRRQTDRNTWWWCEEVQQAIKEKKETYRSWQRERTEENRRVYRQKARAAKRAVAAAKERAWAEWSVNIETAEGKQKMFKIAKQMREERKDVGSARYVKDENGNIVVEEVEITDRWRRYFNDLLNEENGHTLEEVEKVEGPVLGVQAAEVEMALNKMKIGKAPGPSGVTSDLLKYAGDTGTRELVKICRRIEEEGKMPDDWGNSLTVPVFKGKGDALTCGKYRGIRLLEHAMKLWEKILEGRLREVVKVDENQFGFQQGKATTDAIFIMRQMQEKYGEKKRKLYHIFVDLEKAFDRVPREAIVWALRRQKVPERLISLVMTLYVNTRSNVKVAAGTSEEFGIGVGVHQGSALSPLLFVVVMQEATKDVRDDGIMELLYADDLVLTAETEEGVVEKFRAWKEEMETRGLKVNMDKTKMMVLGGQAGRRLETGRYPCGCCGRGVGVNSIWCAGCSRWCHQRCSGLRDIRRGPDNFRCPTCCRGPEEMRRHVAVGDEQIEVVDSFCYLGDMMRCEGGAEAAVRCRIGRAWSKWREISSLLVNQSIPLRSRTSIYAACIRPVLVYGAETWALTKKLEDLMHSCDCRMMRYMAGIRWEDRVSNVEVEERCGLGNLVGVLRRTRLRWFGHVSRREEGHIIKRAMDLEVGGRRPAGRPRRRWRQCIEEDMRFLNITEDMAGDRNQWKRLIRGPTP